MTGHERRGASGRSVRVEVGPEVDFRDVARSLRDDRVERTELDLAMRRDGQRLSRPVHSGTAQFDVSAPLRVDDEAEAAEDPDQLRARQAPEPRRFPVRK